MKRSLPTLVGLLLIGLGGCLGLEALSIFDRLLWEARQWEAHPDGAGFMRTTGLEIGALRIPENWLGGVTAILFGLSVVLIWFGFRFVITRRFFRPKLAP